MTDIQVNRTTHPVSLFDGTAALEYRQTPSAYICRRGELMESDEMLLTAEQKNEFKRAMMIAGYKQLYENGYITLTQLDELLKMHERSDGS